MKIPSYAIVQQLDPPNNRPWRIIETYITSDGIRSRICQGAWKTFAEARATVVEKEKAHAPGEANA